MKIRTFLSIASGIALVFGLGMLLMPSVMAIMYGFGTSPSEILLARFFGVELLMTGVIYWLARGFSRNNARPLITGGLIGHLAGTIIALLGTLNGVMNTSGWSAVAIYFLLFLGFTYFQFSKPAG